MERLDKLLSGTGHWSRREVKELVRQGRVQVSGQAALKAEQKVDPVSDTLEVDGVPVSCGEFTYVMLNKPAGVLSAVEDRKQKTVLDLLPQHLRRRGLSPVGRLDKDTEGLLLLTDDGEMTHRLLSPKCHVDKVYYARVEGTVAPGAQEAFRQGLLLPDGMRCLPAELEILAPGEVCVTLHEGKFHQVKRMLAACGAPVAYLRRLSMGPLRLDETLAPGQFRPLSQEEIADLRFVTGK